jgi:DNA-directed RNA polymerase subunit M
MFCPKCGTILMPKMVNGKRALVCVKCGYKSDSDEGTTIKEQVKHTTKEVQVIEKESNDALPLVDAKCKKCGHTKAYHWELQTRSADEPATRFYKCEKCKYTWREYK